MGGRTDPSGRARLFLALDLSEEARGRLVAWRAGALGGREELRLVAAEALHVTLVFLGPVDEGRVEAVADAGLGALEGLEAPALGPAEVRGIPARRPRLLALDLADEGDRAAAAARAAAGALVAAGLHEPERRAFWPHLTLARVRSGARLDRTSLDSSPPPGPFTVSSATLYRSHLSPRGARYEALWRITLGRGA